MNTRPMTVVTGLLLAACALGTSAVADEADTEEPLRDLRRDIERIDSRNRADYGSRTNYLVRPGLLADRSKRTVTCYAEATAIRDDEPVEFFLIGPQSGHDYEAVARAHVSPGDVRQALLFLGMQPGRSVDADALRFWPKGERVIVHVAWTEEGVERQAGIEELVFDHKTGKPLDASGLVFTGSRYVEDRDGRQVLAADWYEPHSIAANYNERDSVLDVPRRAAQADMYRRQTLNPKLRLPTNCLLRVTLKPECEAGRRRVLDAAMHVSSATNRPAADLRDLTVRIEAPAESKPWPPKQPNGLAGAFEMFRKAVGSGRDPFVTLHLGSRLSLAVIHRLCTLLAAVEGEAGIRVDPPPTGDLHYRAFLPPESYRDREERIGQPWELHVGRAEDGGYTALLCHIEQIWREGKLRPDLDVTEVPLDGPSSLREEIDARGPGLAAIIVYAPGEMTYGHLMRFLRPMLATHPNIHVFLEDNGPPDGEAARPAAAP